MSGAEPPSYSCAPSGLLFMLCLSLSLRLFPLFTFHFSLNFKLIPYALQRFDKPVSNFFSQLGDVDINRAADDGY